MTMPFYVAPEQVMKDRAEYAQKGIARGRSLVATVYDGGILMVAENPSRSLHKVSEIYDRIAFAGVGKYNEFDQLRVAGVRHADTKGYAFSREDVDARSLANLYAQYLGQVFTHEMKPLEVEILVAELGADGKPDQLYHIPYDGTITDEDRFAVLGGETETITDRVAEAYRDGWALDAALRAAVAALAGPDRTLGARGPRGGRAGPGQRPPGLSPARRSTELSRASEPGSGAAGRGRPGRAGGGGGSRPARATADRCARSSARLGPAQQVAGGVLLDGRRKGLDLVGQQQLAGFTAWSTTTSTSTGPGGVGTVACRPAAGSGCPRRPGGP